MESSKDNPTNMKRPASEQFKEDSKRPRKSDGTEQQGQSGGSTTAVPSWVQVIADELLMSSEETADLLCKVRKLPNELRIPSTFISKDGLYNEHVTKTIGEGLLRALREKCEALQMKIVQQEEADRMRMEADRMRMEADRMRMGAERILMEVKQEGWYKDLRIIYDKECHQESFDSALISFMVDMGFQRYSDFKHLVAESVGKYFSDTVTTALINNLCGTDSLTTWETDNNTKYLVNQPVLRVPNTNTNTKIAYNEELLRVNNIQLNDNQSGYDSMLDKLQQRSIVVRDVDLSTELRILESDHVQQFLNNEKEGFVSGLSQKLNYYKMFETSSYTQILRNNVDDEDREITYARTGYSGLYHAATFHLVREYRLRFDLMVRPLVPMEHNGKLIRLNVKPDIFGSKKDRACFGGTVEEKVNGNDFSTNIIKSVFLCLVQWKQFQLYSVNLEMDSLKLPFIVVHTSKLHLYGFCRTLPEPVSSNDKFEFEYSRLKSYDLLTRSDYISAQNLVYNYFCYYEVLLSKCDSTKINAANHYLSQLSDFGKSSSNARTPNASSSNNYSDGNGGGRQTRAYRRTKSGLSRDSSLAFNNGTEEEDTDLLVCDCLHLRFEGSYPPDEFGLANIGELEVKSSGVILASDENHGQLVVKYSSFDNDAIVQVKRDAKVLKRLNNARFSSCPSLITSEKLERYDLLVLATSYCGTPIRSTLSLVGKKWKQYARGLMSAVIGLHKNNIIHCDLSDNNVCVLFDEIRIIDFGLSEDCDDHGVSLRQVYRKGTKGFIAPEFSKDNKIFITTAVDVFSVGALLKVLWSRVTNTSVLTGDTMRRVNGLLEGMMHSSADMRPKMAQALDSLEKMKL